MLLKRNLANLREDSILGLAIRTWRADAESYSSRETPLSLQRFLQSVWPRLDSPIFLVGAPRSGTTFLGACLASLPQVSYHYEPVATRAVARSVYEGRWSIRKARAFYRQVYRWLLRIHLNGHLRFAEKTPRNCFLIPFLRQTFPDSQFIHIIRDGRDVAHSLYQKPWLKRSSLDSGIREPGADPFGPHARFWVETERRSEFEATTDMHRCIWAWRRHVESVLIASGSLPCGQYTEIRYESLVADPVREAERLMDFLGIEAVSDREDFFAAICSANARSVGKWQHALTTKELSEIEGEAGSLLRQLGYV